MKRRVFAAIAVSEKLRREILEWEKTWRALPVRWLEGKNLHITLVPPWYADENEMENTKNKLAEAAAGASSFEIEFNKISYGPDSRSPRLIWAEGRAPKEAVDLKNRLEKLLDAKNEYRNWKMHLTLARFRPEDFQNFPVKKLDEKTAWRERVDSIVLMESRLSPRGADYEILKKFKLQKT